MKDANLLDAEYVVTVQDGVTVYEEVDGIVLNLGNDEYEVVEPEYAAKVVFPLLPIITNCVRGVEATFLAPSAEKHRLCLGTVGTIYRNLDEQPLDWVDIESLVSKMIPPLVEFYNEIGVFKHHVRQKALAEVENEAFPPVGEYQPTPSPVAQSKPSRMQWVDQVPVYQGCVPTIEADLDALPDSLQAAIDEHYTVN